MWNNSDMGELGCTEAKWEVGAVAQVRKDRVARGNDGEKHLGCREL